MNEDRRPAAVRRLAEDPASGALLYALGDGRALTAAELARSTGLARDLVATLLAQLAHAGLVRVVQQGPHRYHRLRVADACGLDMPRAWQPKAKPAALATGPCDTALRAARTCYGHLAGGLGIALADALSSRGHVELSDDDAVVTEKGMALLARVGIDLAPLAAAQARGDRALCRPCLDWSERRPHIGGRLGAALCAHAFQHRWIERMPGTRAVTVTAAGRRGLQAAYGVRGASIGSPGTRFAVRSRKEIRP